MRTLAVALLCARFGAQDDPKKEKGPVSARLEPAFGRVVPVEWKTYILEVSNPNAVEFDIVATVGSDAERINAVRREKMPPRTTKRLFFYLPNRSLSHIAFRVEDAKGRVLTRGERSDEGESVTRHYWGSATTPKIPVLALMERMPVRLPGPHNTAQCRESRVPDRWIGLEGFDAVFMRDFQLDQLLPPQRAALHEWVRRGGRLILYPGTNRDWLASRAVQEFAPVSLGESAEATELPELEAAHGGFSERTPFVLHRILNGTRVVGGDPPVAVEFRRGAGRVVVLAVDLDRAPFDTWRGAEAFRAALVGAPAPEGERPSKRSLPVDVEQVHAWATETVSTLPPFLLLLGLTIAFIVVVGPVNYLVLKRLKMMLLIVVTVPAISAGFLVLIIGAGYVLRGATTVTFDVCMLKAASGDDTAEESHVLSIFSPGARTYDIAWSGTEVGTPHGRDSTYGNRDEGDIVFDQSDRWTLKGYAFSQWQSRAFLGRAARPLDGSVSFSLAGGQLRIVNTTPFAIVRGIVIDPGSALRYGEFGEVAAGRTASFTPRFRHELGDPPAALEGRVLIRWLEAHGHNLGAPVLVCVLDRLPDEIGLDATRAMSSERVCFLQVTGDRR
jgi:hypothetical protein